jgi:hypothetical protein
MGSMRTRASEGLPAAPGYRALDRNDEAHRSAAPAPVDERALGGEPAILCARCDHPITTPGARISVLEAHQHRFMNPAGLLFHIGCFARADGCVVIGPASDDYPWFPGFAWRLALCGACAEHLGWHFQAGGQAFYGLRLDRLRAAAGPPAA